VITRPPRHDYSGRANVRSVTATGSIDEYRITRLPMRLLSVLIANRPRRQDVDLPHEIAPARGAAEIHHYIMSSLSYFWW
jgi:hypothetical protein